MIRAAALALVLAAACASSPPLGAAPAPAPSPPPARYRLEEVPRELQPALARADAAVRTLREQIAARVASEIASGGVQHALAEYRRDVPALSAAISAQTGVLVGRTSARLGAGATAPRRWIAPLLEGTPPRRAADVPPVVLDLGDRLALLRPIAVTGACLTCHGSADRILPEVKLAADGGSTSFVDGELRGYFWAEAKK